jgi:carbon monoxide dehydrogenase subunit G
MKLEGTHKFKASSAQVFNAILDPEVLKSAIPGCEAASASSNQLEVMVTTPLPGLHGPFPVVIDVANKQAPNSLELRVQLSGKPGSVNAVCKISLADEADGSLLTYEANAELEGMMTVADNPIGRPIVKNCLNTFLKNLEKSVEAARV